MTWTERIYQGLLDILATETYGVSRHVQDRPLVERLNAAIMYCEVRRTRKPKKARKKRATITPRLLGPIQVNDTGQGEVRQEPRPD